MRTHLSVALMVAICAVTAVAATRIEVTQGVKKFADGDSIAITEVSSEKGTLAVGDTVTVKGTYTLASQKNARLLLSVTRDAKQAPLPEQGKGIARKTINAGTGEYEMTISIPQEGWLHLGLYNPETGKPFGQLYFGTKEQMDKIANWNLDYVTSEQSGKNNISFCFSVQADEQVGYEVNLDGKLVSSDRALVKQYQFHNLAAVPGDHVLTVTAPGYETWQKTITLLEGVKNGRQSFLVELKKSTPCSQAVANSVPKNGDNTISFLCRVQAEAEVFYEIHIDGKVVGSGNAIPNSKDKMTHILSATPGDHILTITAPGYETWQKTITLSADSKIGQNILAELKKSER